MNDITPPHADRAWESAETALEAVAAAPLVGGSLSIVLHKGLTYRLEHRRDEWFGELAVKVEEIRQRPDAPTLDEMLDDPRFVDAVVSSARTVEHTH